MILNRLTDFKLNAFYDYVPIISHNWETGMNLNGILPWIDAKVPGCVYSDLLRAGLIRDPYYDMQSLESEWVKDRWWVYDAKFRLQEKAKHLRLTCKGIDYKARISLNGQQLGEHEGMYVPFRADITEQLRADEDNELIVTLEHAPDEMGQIGYTEKTWTQKARFCYHWDWCPRMVHLGLYDDVLIEGFGDGAIDECDIRPVKTSEGWKVSCGLGITGYAAVPVQLDFELSRNGKRVAAGSRKADLREGFQTIDFDLDAGQPELWYPAGHGIQPLYDLVVTLTDPDGVSDQVSHRVGFRTLEYLPCDGAPSDALPYLPVINGKKIYLKGSNFVPADMMYGALTREDYRAVLEKARDANLNLLRVWGGGLIEKEDFYDLCDELGILVMQEFIQSSSGLSNEPSQDPHFLELCRATAVEATKTRRNHVSLTFWTGGNELYTDEGPVDFTHPTIRMLQKIVWENNPGVFMLPASPSGPRKGSDTDYTGPDHDIHNEWKYGGVVDHYTRYNTADCMLHSEFGVDGMANLETLRQAVSPAHQKVAFFKDDMVLRHHGEVWDTLYRDYEIFGPFAPDELETYIQCSQFIQGEGLRYSLEANRRRQFQNCGSITWQFNEPWPNVSCTNLLDYYRRPKLAYWMVRDANRPCNLSLRYDKLLWKQGEEYRAGIFVSNDGQAFDFTAHVTVKDDQGRLLFEQSFPGSAPENSSAAVGTFSLTVPDCRGLFIEVSSPELGIVSRYLALVENEQGKADRETVCAFVHDYLSHKSGMPED